MAPTEFDVFISFKNLDEQGASTPDGTLATEVYDFLASRGIKVFFSNVTLEKLGISAYKRAIDDALDGSRILVAVGTSPEHLDWEWVRYEWDSFYSDILSGVKPEGRVFVYLDGPDILLLPRALRQSQCFHHGPGSLERLYNFVASALGYGSSQAPLPSARPVQRADLRQKVSRRGAYLSYAHADEGYAQQLSAALTMLGISCLRIVDVLAGSNYIASVLKAIEEATVLVVLLSENAATSKILKFEVLKAFELKKPILPVLIDDVYLSREPHFMFYVSPIAQLDARHRSARDVAPEVAAAIGRLRNA